MLWNAVQLSAPGNLLLLGEYAVTQPQGLGVWIAPDIRAQAQVSLETTEGWEIQGLWPGETVLHQVDPDLSPLAMPSTASPIAASTTVVKNHLSTMGLRLSFPAFHLTIDSRPLFLPDGRKRGLGSSAVVCLLGVAALIELAARDQPWALQTALRREIPYLAIEAQRLFQQGRGSGYDVAASFWGGMGRFEGGSRPAMQRLDQDLPWPIGIQPGLAAVRTVDAIGQWQAWQAAAPEGFEAWFNQSNGLVREFLAALADSNAAATTPNILIRARDLGIALGEAIGVPATMAAPVMKALGAGNEIGLVIGAAATVPTPLSRQGLIIEYQS